MLRLKELRIEKELNQEELAKVFNITQQMLSKYESGKNEPDIETQKKMADYFNVSTDYLLGRTNIRQDLSKYNFAKYEGLDLEGLDEDDLEDLQRAVDLIKELKKKRK